MSENWISLFLGDYTLQIVILGTSILGATSGALGTFALLKNQSLLGDAISHAALPGIVGIFLITHSKNPIILLLGGAIAGLIGIVLFSLITHYTSLKKDSILGIILSVFFGFGLVLMTIVQKYPIANQALLNKFIFGCASTILIEDLYIMLISSVIVTIILFAWWKQMKLSCFDATFAYSIGYKPIIWDVILNLLLVLIIATGLQTIGVVLMSSLIIAPAAAAKQWASTLEKMIFISSIIGALTCASGSIISSLIDQVPTGPTIVILVSLVVFYSLLFAPNRLHSNKLTRDVS